MGADSIRHDLVIKLMCIYRDGRLWGCAFSTRTAPEIERAFAEKNPAYTWTVRAFP